jgi:hypothetical protein
VQPGGESRFAPEGPNFTKELKKSFLHQIFRIGGIPDHAKAKSVDPSTMQLIEMFEGGGVA